MRTGEQRLPAVLENKLLKRIKEDGGHPSKWTGANRTDIALHWIYRSCLSENHADLKLLLKAHIAPSFIQPKKDFSVITAIFSTEYNFILEDMETKF